MDKAALARKLTVSAVCGTPHAKFGEGSDIPIATEESRKERRAVRSADDVTVSTRKKDLFGGCFRLCAQGDGWEQYEMLPCTGRGTMKLCRLLPGVEAVFQTFQAKSCFSKEAAVLPHLLEVNYCRSGRYECELPGRTFVYMGPRDVVMNPLSNQMRSSSFPLEEYTGTALLLDLEEMEKSHALFAAMGVEPAALRQRCYLPGQCRVFRGEAGLCALFDSMTDKMNPGLMRLRTLEILAQLCGEGERAGAAPAYYPRKVIEAVKAAREELLATLDRVPLSDLAVRHGLSRRALIDGFRGVYGETPYVYLRQYRIHRAAAQLADPQVCIGRVASDAGYQNASKFSKAFRMVMGMSPSDYQKNSCTAGAPAALAE